MAISDAPSARQPTRDTTARRENATLDAADRLRLLLRSGEILASSLNWQKTIDQAARIAVPAFTDLCIIDIIVGTAIRPVGVAHADPAAELAVRDMRERFPLDLSSPAPVGQVARSGQSLLIPIVQDDLQRAIAQSDVHVDILLDLNYRSAMVVPLIARGRTLGTIMYVLTTDRPPYAAEDLVFAEELARRVAMAVDNARLYTSEQAARHEAEQAVARWARLHTVTAALTRAVTPGDVARVVLEDLVETTGALAGSVLLFIESPDVLDLVGAVGYPAEMLDGWQRVPMTLDIQATEAVRKNEPVWISSRAEVLERYPSLRGVSATAAESFAAIPLATGGEPIGVLGLSFPGPRELDGIDQSYILLLTEQASQALERARLFRSEHAARATAERAVRTRDEFLSIASHELKTPLTTVKGSTQLLRRQFTGGRPDLTRIERFSETLEGQVGRLEALVADLLDISRIDQGRDAVRMEPTDLVRLARRLTDEIRESPDWTAAHRVVLDTPESATGVWDTIRIEQALTNLLTNALRYSPEGGEVRVSVHASGDGVVIAVADDGIGIPADEHELLFQPFSRSRLTRRTIDGTGLGLYITARIVERHGGTIGVQSEPGHGSTFTITLPRDSTSISQRRQGPAGG